MIRHHGKKIRVKKPHAILFLIIIFSCLTATVSAGAPPPEYRVGYLLPVSHDARNYYSTNQAVSPNAAYNVTISSWDIIPVSDYSTNERFLETDYLDPVENPHSESPFPLFPVLSGYWRSQKYVDFSQDMTLITLDWYCDNGSTFVITQKELFKFMSVHGSIENTTVDLSTALAKTKNPYLENITERQIPVTRYESSSTSGFFTFHSTPSFPGDKYRISYYGTTGSVSYHEGKIADYGTPGTANLNEADGGIRDLMVKKIFKLVDANPHPPAYWGSNVSQNTTMPFFPDLSPYRGYKKLVSLKTGNQYISEVWFFNDGSQFSIKKQELLQYLKGRGNVTHISLAISQEVGSNAGHWNVTRYESQETSGYFMIYETTSYPGTNLYILYYGVIGPSGIRQNLFPLNLLIQNVLSPSDITYSLDSPNEEYLSNSPDVRSASAMYSGFIPFLTVGIIILFRRSRNRV